MSTTMDSPTPEAAETAATDIVAIVRVKPEIVLLDKAQGEAFYQAIAAQVRSFVPDVTTQAGRDAIKSLAFKVTRTKTAIDNAGKALNEESRKKISLVDAERREQWKRFEDLATEARKPLTDWEEAQQAQQQYCEGVISQLIAARTVLSTDTAESVAATLAAVQAEPIEQDFGPYFWKAVQEKAQTEAVLHDALDRLRRQEKEALELAQLRAEKAKRDAEDAERARIAEEEKRKAEAAERKRLAEEQRKREEEARQKAEAERIEAERIRQAEEERRRIEDIEHRNAVIGAAEDALVAAKIPAASAKRCIALIVAGKVPGCELRF